MEQKKQLLIKVLQKMETYRNVATGILALVESSYIDEKTIDGVISILTSSIKDVKENSKKQSMKKGLAQIQKIKLLEGNTKMSEKDLDEFLTNNI